MGFEKGFNYFLVLAFVDGTSRVGNALGLKRRSMVQKLRLEVMQVLDT
jgi:hypothetical protein